MRAGFVQSRPELGVVAPNRERAARLIESVEADLLVLPELCTTGYLLDREQAAALAEPLDGPTSEFFARVARARRLTLVYGFVERDGERLYNACAAVGPAGVVGGYRKAHLFMGEKTLFTPGESLPPLLDVASARIGPIICFDWAFPELMRGLCLRGADVVVQPANLVLPWCQQVMAARAIENRVFTITANRIGEESARGTRLSFTGKSQLCSPAGELLLQAPPDAEHAAAVEIDPLLARDKRINPLNDLFADRRTDLY